jgi:hypothetical protein
MINEQDLMIEIGGEAFADLSTDEVDYITENYSDVKQAGMKAFEILWKKFKPTYRMGKLYEKESERYSTYKDIYLLYSKSLGAGRTTSSSTSTSSITRDKF